MHANQRAASLMLVVAKVLLSATPATESSPAVGLINGGLLYPAVQKLPAKASPGLRFVDLCGEWRAMNALRSPVPGRRAAALLPLVLLCASLAVAAEEAATGEEPKEESKLAVWRVKEVSFSYRSSVAIYSCKVLHDRVVSILRTLGVRDDLEVKVSGCDVPSFSTSSDDDSTNPWPTTNAGRAFDQRNDPFLDPRTSRLNRTNALTHANRGQMANVHARVLIPAEVTPEVVDELYRDKSRRELISRVTGNPAAKNNVPVAFAAKWQTVTLSHESIGLEPEECELLEQISNGALKPLGVRIVKKSRNCDPDRVSRIPPQLTAEVLVGVPFEDPRGMVPQWPPPAAGDGSTTTEKSDAAQPATEPVSVKPQE
jgi:hypothetical protein